MARSLDKSLGRSFTEIGEILGLTPKQVEHTYVKAMKKIRAENPENGQELLDRLKTGGRQYAKRTTRKPSCDLRSSPDIDLDTMSAETPLEELPEEIYAED